MITDKEKEELFDEFLERLESEKSVAYLKKKNFKPARDYFDQQYIKYQKLLGKSKLRTNYYIWPIISKVMCHSTGNEYIHKVKPEYLEITNAFGMRLIDLYFEFLTELAKRKGEITK